MQHKEFAVREEHLFLSRSQQSTSLIATRNWREARHAERQDYVTNQQKNSVLPWIILLVEFISNDLNMALAHLNKREEEKTYKVLTLENVNQI